MSTRIRFSRTYPLPNYDGPTPVHRAHFPWAGAVDCYVRRNPQTRQWETAVADRPLALCTFIASPVAGAAETRYAAVMAFDYYHGRKSVTS